MIDRKKLGYVVRNYISRYLNLKVLDYSVQCPYSINYVEEEFLSLMRDAGVSKDLIDKVHQGYKGNKSKYGWYRGKGTPEELEEAFMLLAEERGFNLQKVSEEGIREIMKLLGLGIDCSGYIYNVLLGGFRSIDMEEEFVNSLLWGDPARTGVSKASASIFAGSSSSLITDLESLSDLDLLLLKNREAKYTHIAMVLRDDEKFELTQSIFTVLPNGVRVDKLCVENNFPRFGFKVDMGTDWETLYKRGQIEFRRLKILM